jgi:hypothetical protein
MTLRLEIGGPADLSPDMLSIKRQGIFHNRDIRLCSE